MSLLYPYHTQLTLCLPPHSLPLPTPCSVSLSADYFNMRLSIERSVTLAWHGPGSGSCKRNTQKILLKNTAGPKPKTVDPACLPAVAALPRAPNQLRGEPKPSQGKPTKRTRCLALLFLFFLSNDVLKWKQARVVPAWLFYVYCLLLLFLAPLSSLPFSLSFSCVLLLLSSFSQMLFVPVFWL